MSWTNCTNLWWRRARSSQQGTESCYKPEDQCGSYIEDVPLTAQEANLRTKWSVRAPVLGRQRKLAVAPVSPVTSAEESDPVRADGSGPVRADEFADDDMVQGGRRFEACSSSGYAIRS